jgi:penicillin-binding protein 1A
LQPYPATALGGSEVNLLELATVYRSIASGLSSEPYVIQRIVRRSGDAILLQPHTSRPLDLDAGALALIQEGLRGVVRLPTGTAHALDSRAFPVAVMGKTGTTNDFKDALFVGSTYGAEGVTVAVRIGFDDGRSLGAKETGSRLALPVFREVILRMYQHRVAGLAPAFPSGMESNITRYLRGDETPPVADTIVTVVSTAGPLRNRVEPKPAATGVRNRTDDGSTAR